MKKSKLLLGVFAGILIANMATAATPIWGTHVTECPANSDTYIGIVSTRAPAFTGKVQSVQGGTSNIVAQGEPNWSANQFVYSSGVQPNHYYLKFTSGALEGAWYDITANGAYYATIEIGNSELAKISAGDSFEIIPHWTLATLFPDGGGFTKSTKIAMGAGATYLYKYTKWNNGLAYQIGTNRAAADSFFFRDRGSAVGWRNGAKADASDEVIEPNGVLKVVQPEGESCTVSVSGVIPMCATSFEVFTVEEDGVVQNQDIYAAVPSAVDIKLSDLTESFVDSGVFAPSTGIVSTPVDTLFLYQNKREGKNLVADESCYYRKRGSTSKWLDSSKADADDLSLKAATVLQFRKKSGNAAAAYRCTFAPAYINQ